MYHSWSHSGLGIGFPGTGAVPEPTRDAVLKAPVIAIACIIITPGGIVVQAVKRLACWLISVAEYPKLVEVNEDARRPLFFWILGNSVSVFSPLGSAFSTTRASLVGGGSWRLRKHRPPHSVTYACERSPRCSRGCRALGRRSRPLRCRSGGFGERWSHAPENGSAWCGVKTNILRCGNRPPNAPKHYGRTSATFSVRISSSGTALGQV